MASDLAKLQSEDKAVIIGGGFGGLAAAVALQKVGIPSIVLEKARHARSEGFSIGTFTNGWRALDELGVGDALRSEHLNLKRLTFCDIRGNIMKSFEIADCSPPPYRPEHELRVIMREAIPRYLTQQLLPGVVHYGESVVDVTVSPTGAKVTLEGGEKLSCRFVVLADGVHSKTAAKLHKAQLHYMHKIGWRAIVEIDSEALEHPCATFAQDKGVRIGMIPVKYDAASKKALWYWFLATAADDNEEFGDAQQQKEEMKRLVKGWNVGIFQQLLEATPPEQIKLSKIYQRQVEAGQPWFEGCMTGVGDACHATTPFLGQGGAMALESGVELGVFLKEAMQEAGGVPFAQLPPDALCAALREYETVRSRRVAFIINKSRKFGETFRKRPYLVQLLFKTLLRVGLVSFPVTTDTFLDHATWEPSGSLSSGAASSTEKPNKAAYVKSNVAEE